MSTSRTIFDLYPQGFRLTLDPSLKRPRRDLVIGGSPLRVLRLSSKGAEVLDRWSSGSAVGSSGAERRLARRLVDAGLAHPRPGRGEGMEAGKVAVVIPVRDRAEGLRATLAALGGLRILVVDDASTPPLDLSGALGTPEPPDSAGQPALPPLGSRLSLVRRDRPGGPAAARNTGWRTLVGRGVELVVFLDADCVPEQGWLEPLLAHFADPAVGAVAPRVKSDPLGDVATIIAAYEQAHSPLDLGPLEAPVRPGSRVPYVPSAALAVRLTALQESGGFEKALRFGEDVDLVWRLHEAGWRVRYEPSAVVRHPPRSSLAALALQRYQYGTSAAPLALRHPGAVAPLRVSPWSVACWVLALAGRPLAGSALALYSAIALSWRFRRDPRIAWALAGMALRGHLLAGPSLAEALRRCWLPPLAALGALLGPKGRHRLARAVLVAFGMHVCEAIAKTWGVWRSGDQEHGLAKTPWSGVRWLVMRLVDDLAYQAGVWGGSLAWRTSAALVPRAPSSSARPDSRWSRSRCR